MRESTEYYSKKIIEKLAHRNRANPIEWKLSLKSSLVKVYVMLVLIWGTKFWYASEIILKQMEKFRRKKFKRVRSSIHFQKKNNNCFRSFKLVSILHHRGLMDLVIWSKSVTSRLSLAAEQIWKMRNGHPKHKVTRKNFYTQKNLIIRVADAIFSTKL